MWQYFDNEQDGTYPKNSFARLYDVFVDDVVFFRTNVIIVFQYKLPYSNNKSNDQY